MSYWLIMGDVDSTGIPHGDVMVFLQQIRLGALITIQQLSQDDLWIHLGGVHLTRATCHQVRCFSKLWYPKQNKKLFPLKNVHV